jgi:hypothetical protein
MDDNLLNGATEISDNCVSPVQNRAVAQFSSLPVLILIIWSYRNKGNWSLYCRYEGVVSEETVLVTVLGFIDDAKKKFLYFWMNVCIYWIARKFPFWSFLTVFVPEITFLGAFAKFRKATIIVVMSVCPSLLMEHLNSHWTDLHKIW